MAEADDSQDILHATTVAIENRAVVIHGPSGAGKSSLALQLIALGARLVADDRTILRRQGDTVLADVPETIAGRIEARGVGLLTLRPARGVPVALVVDLARREEARLPEPHVFPLLGRDFPCLWAAPGGHFAAAILLWAGGNITPQT